MRHRVSLLCIVNTLLIERVLLFAGLHLNQSMCVERMRREALEALAPEDGGRLLADLGAARSAVVRGVLRLLFRSSALSGADTKVLRKLGHGTGPSKV